MSSRIILIAYLIAKVGNVAQIFLGYFSAHWDLGRLFHLLLHVFRQNVVQLHGGRVRLVAHLFNNLAVGNVILYDLGQLGKMPAVPLFTTHDVIVELFVQIVQECLNSFNQTVQQQISNNWFKRNLNYRLLELSLCLLCRDWTWVYNGTN